MRACRLVPFIIAVASLLVPLASQAQGRDKYPSRPITMIVPYLAGGSGDLLARMVGQHLTQRSGQTVIVENRVGAGGTIGAAAVAKAAPDGYTLLFTSQGPLTINPFLLKSIPYDGATAFAPISVVVEAPNVLVVNPQMPVSSLKELIAYGKQNPAAMTFATQGVGNTGHITGLIVNQQTGMKLAHIPYKGYPPMYVDVAASRVGMMIADTLLVVPHVRSKELKPIAIAAEKRSSVLPEVPTFKESGYPEIVSGPWFAMLAPAGTPMEVRRYLSNQVKEILKIPAVAERMKELGAEPRGTSPEEFEAFYKAEYKRMGDIITSAGIKTDQ
jgi:tripartite-type tricarboxylate transporter receptor subunit TctC